MPHSVIRRAQGKLWKSLQSRNRFSLLPSKKALARHLSLAPELNEQDNEQHSQKNPRDQDYLDSQFADGRNVVGYIWIFTKESVAIAKDVDDSK
jgi:hypothetical protein